MKNNNMFGKDKKNLIYGHTMKERGEDGNIKLNGLFYSANDVLLPNCILKHQSCNIVFLYDPTEIFLNNLLAWIWVNNFCKCLSTVIKTAGHSFLVFPSSSY